MNNTYIYYCSLFLNVFASINDDCSGMFNDSKELEALGMDRLKEGLEALGLKCGGTLQDRAKRSVHTYTPILIIRRSFSFNVYIFTY